MPVQITPYKGSNPLKAIALGNEIQQGRQRLAQNERRIGLSERQIDMAAQQLGLRRDEFLHSVWTEAIANSENAEQAAQYLSAIYPMAPEAQAKLRSLPPEMFGSAFRGTEPAQLRTYRAMQEDLKSDDRDVRRSAELALGFTPRAVGNAAITLASDTAGVTAGEVADVEREIAFGKDAGKKTAGRLGDAITEGLLAADSTASIRRALQLIDSGVDTSRLGQAELSFMQSLGIEDPEAGELSNLLGKAVLSQLRSTFGAAFTENEGARLERIEAGFGRNPATNERLLRNALQIAEASAERGIKAAEKSKDDLAVEQIQGALSLQLGVTPQPNGEYISREELEDEARRRGLIK